MKTLISAYRIYFQFLSFLSIKIAAKQAFKLFCTPLNKKLRDREKEILRKAKVSFLQYNTIKICRYEWGEGTRIALLVHGWEGNAGGMGAFIDLLLRKGYKVVAIDAPAHGNSSGRRTSLFEYSQAISFVLSDLGNVKIILSHSFGSVVSLLSLSLNPAIKIDKMVMLTTPDRIVTPFTDFFNLMQLQPKVREEIFKQVQEKYKVEVSSVNASELATRVEIPTTLIIHDREEKIIPFESSERVAAALKNSKLIEINKVGHYRMLWHNDVVQLVDEFI